MEVTWHLAFWSSPLGYLPALEQYRGRCWKAWQKHKQKAKQHVAAKESFQQFYRAEKTKVVARAYQGNQDLRIEKLGQKRNRELKHYARVFPSKCSMILSQKRIIGLRVEQKEAGELSLLFRRFKVLRKWILELRTCPGKSKYSSLSLRKRGIIRDSWTLQRLKTGFRLWLNWSDLPLLCLLEGRINVLRRWAEWILFVRRKQPPMAWNSTVNYQAHQEAGPSVKINPQKI